MISWLEWELGFGVGHNIGWDTGLKVAGSIIVLQNI